MIELLPWPVCLCPPESEELRDGASLSAHTLAASAGPGSWSFGAGLRRGQPANRLPLAAVASPALGVVDLEAEVLATGFLSVQVDGCA